MASTSSLALTFPGKWFFVVNLGMFTDGFSVMKNVLPDCSCHFLASLVTILQPAEKLLNMQTQGVTIKERKRKLLVKD